MSELTTRQFPNDLEERQDRARRIADGLLAIAVLTMSAAVTVAWIVTLYWMAGAFFSEG